MKNLRKLLAVVVVVAMMATFMIPAFAEESTLSNAEICETLGMLKGTGDGVTDEYLASATERNQAAIMFLRLQGLEDEALAYDGEDNFDDADELWAGGQAILAYLKANPDLGWQGVGDNKFEPRVNIDAKSYYKVLLEALGYKQDVDFEWGEVLEFAAEKGLSAIADVDELTNADIATATVEALKATVKDSELTLIEKLIADGIIDEDAAVDAGLVSGELAIAEFKAAGVKIMTVKFNKAVEDTSKMVFGLKRDGINVNIKTVSWNDAKTEATLAVSYKLLDGDYAVTATYDGGDALTATAENVKEAKVSAITFIRDKAIISSDDKLSLKAFIKIENQYGEDVSNDIDKSELTISASKYDSSSTPGYEDGAITLVDKAGSPYEVDKTVVVTVVHKATATIGTATLTISQAAEVSSIEFGELTPEDEDMDADLYVGCEYGRYYIPITVKDQYGNVLKKDEIVLAAKISSDKSILNIGAIDTIDDQTVLRLAVPDGGGKSGTVVITAVALTGKTANKTVIVKESNVIDTLTLQSPESPLKEGTWSTIPFTAVDPYGVELVSANDLAFHTDPGSEGGDGVTDNSIKFADGTTVTVTNASIKMDIDYNKDDARTIKVRPIDADISVTFTVVTSKAKVQTLTLSVEDAPAPNSIDGLKDDFKKAIANQTGLTENLELDYIKLTDQYGDSIKLPAGYEIRISGSGVGGNFEKVTVGGAAIPTKLDVETTTVGVVPVAKGNETIKLQLVDTTPDPDKVIDEYTFTMQVVDFKDISAFEIGTLKKFYVGKTCVAGDPYALAFEVVGLKGSTKVKVDQNIAGASSSVADTAIAGGKITVTSDIDTDGADKTGKLTVVYEAYSGVKTLTKDFVYSSATPVATKFELRDSNGDEITDAAKTYTVAELDGKSINSVLGIGEAAAAFQFYVEDQYGVAINDCTYVPTNKSRAEISVASGILSVEADDTFTITAITKNGLSKSLKVIVK